MIEGALHVVRLTDSVSEPRYGVGFAGYQVAPSGTMKMREFVGEKALRDYLTRQVRVRLDVANVALRDLSEKGNAGIERVQLPFNELADLGLK